MEEQLKKLEAFCAEHNIGYNKSETFSRFNGLSEIKYEWEYLPKDIANSLLKELLAIRRAYPHCFTEQTINRLPLGFTDTEVTFRRVFI